MSNESPAMNAASPTDDQFVQGMLTEVARMGASPAGLSLAVQLFGVGPCAGCGYRKLHCRCAAPVGQGSASVAINESSASAVDNQKSGNLSDKQGSATSGEADQLNGGMHASIFVKVWGDAGGGDAGRIALAEYAFKLGQRAALAAKAEQSNTPVLYQMQMCAPNGRCGPWHDASAELYERYRANPDIGDGFSNEVRALFAATVAERAATIEIDGRTYTADEIKGRIKQLDAEAESVSEQHAAGAKRIEELEAIVAERAAAPASVPEGWKLVPMKLTEEMHVAAVRAIVRSTGNDDFPPAVWSAMISAAPEVAQPAAQGEHFCPECHLQASMPDREEMAIMGRSMSNWLVGLAKSEGIPDSWRTTCATLAQGWNSVASSHAATPAPTAGEPSACPTCPKETPYGPAICGKCAEAGAKG